MMSQSEPPDVGRIVPLTELAERMRSSEHASADLLTAVVASTCRRMTMMGGTARSARINKLIQAGAWVDTALDFALSKGASLLSRMRSAREARWLGVGRSVVNDISFSSCCFAAGGLVDD